MLTNGSIVKIYPPPAGAYFFFYKRCHVDSERSFTKTEPIIATIVDYIVSGEYNLMKLLCSEGFIFIYDSSFACEMTTICQLKSEKQ